MIDLKQRPFVGWNALFGVSLLAIAATLLFGFAKRDDASTASASKAKLQRVYGRIHTADGGAADSHALIEAKSWHQDIAVLGSKILDMLTQLSEKNHVQLSGFRTEKPVEIAHMKEAPFVVIVEGTFSDVLQFVRTLEAPNSKLAVNLLQVSASDSGAGHVVATMGLVAFLPSEVRQNARS